MEFQSNETMILEEKETPFKSQNLYLAQILKIDPSKHQSFVFVFAIMRHNALIDEYLWMEQSDKYE
ncbi:CLUMA_CG011775, isoform A [Clunio marinus]|uniref:CLUMA_CG011775, isoform A n=1 Tax=Clunio marinus TaxID=568069 RepID=A0A1J1IIZ1_9DIPT|nr:CLUMA_CG011775, isoform A [Clunio marinus]